MKLAIICDDYLPDSTRVGAKMLHELAKELILQGHQPVVITPKSFTFPFKKYEKKIDEVTIWRFWSGKIKDTGSIRRAINESFLSFFAWQQIKLQLKKNTFDGIIYYSPSIFFGPLVAKLKKYFKCRSYLILRDFFPQWAVDANLIKNNSLIHRYFRFFESLSYKNADMIGVMSHGNLKIFNHKTNNRFKVQVLRNWANTEPEDIYNKRDLREILNLKNKIIFFYGGNIGRSQDMKNLMRLANRMKKFRNAHFLFVGQGDEVNLINQLAVKWKLKNFSYLASVTQDEYRSILTQVDIGLFSLSAKHTSHNFPGKLLGYMSYSLPILGSVNKGNDLINLLTDNNAGYITVNGDDDLFFQNAVKLLFSLELRNEIGLAGKELLHKEFNVSRIAGIITNSLQGLEPPSNKININN